MPSEMPSEMPCRWVAMGLENGGWRQATFAEQKAVKMAMMRNGNYVDIENGTINIGKRNQYFFFRFLIK